MGQQTSLNYSSVVWDDAISSNRVKQRQFQRTAIIHHTILQALYPSEIL